LKQIMTPVACYERWIAASERDDTMVTTGPVLSLARLEDDVDESIGSRMTGNCARAQTMCDDIAADAIRRRRDD